MTGRLCPAIRRCSQLEHISQRDSKDSVLKVRQQCGLRLPVGNSNSRMALSFSSHRAARLSSQQRQQNCRPARSMHVRAALTAEKASLDIRKMEPLSDRLLIKPFEEEPKTAAGILLPKGPPRANSDAHFGEVLAVGSDVTLSVKAGDKVVFNKYAMAEVEVPDGDIIFVAEKSILGKLE